MENIETKEIFIKNTFLVKYALLSLNSNKLLDISLKKDNRASRIEQASSKHFACFVSKKIKFRIAESTLLRFGTIIYPRLLSASWDNCVFASNA